MDALPNEPQAQEVYAFLGDVRPSGRWTAVVVLGAAELSGYAEHAAHPEWADAGGLVHRLLGAAFLHWLRAHYPTWCEDPGDTKNTDFVLALLALEDEYRADMQTRPAFQRN